MDSLKSASQSTQTTLEFTCLINFKQCLYRHTTPLQLHTVNCVILSLPGVVSCGRERTFVLSFRGTHTHPPTIHYACPLRVTPPLGWKTFSSNTLKSPSSRQRCAPWHASHASVWAADMRYWMELDGFVVALTRYHGDEDVRFLLF